MIAFRKEFAVVVLIALFVLAACGGSKEPTPLPPTETPVPAAPAEVAAPTEPAAPAEAAAPAGDAKNGETLFNQTCIACHGPGGVGVQGLGKDMTTSTFIKDLDDAQLLEFIKKGRDASDPLNATGVAMPPKGGNPALDDAKLMDIIAYIRTLNKP